MKKIGFLFLLPTLLLASCGLGNEISEEEATTKALAVEKATADAEGYNVEFRVSMAVTYNDLDVKGSYYIAVNKEGEMHVKVSAISDGEKSTYEIFVVKDAEYEEVTYGKGVISGNEQLVAYTKKDNANYDIMAANISSGILSGLAQIINVVPSPSAVISSYSAPVGEEGSIKYYSTGEGNLAIKMTFSGDYKGSATVTYNDNRFAKMEFNYTYSYEYEGQTYKTKASESVSIAYKDSLTFSLPSDWKDALNNQAQPSGDNTQEDNPSEEENPTDSGEEGSQEQSSEEE